jgi:SAM-dependent methyltransferase
MLIDTLKDGYDPKAEYAKRAAAVVAGDAFLTDFDTKVLNTPEYGIADSYWWIFTQALEHLKFRRAYSVLDFGCGYGRCANFLTMFDFARYVGYEPQPERLEYAKAHAMGYGRTFIGNMAELAEGEKFDVIWCCTVIQHLSRPTKLAICEEFKRRMTPGGVIILWEGEVVDGTEEDAERRYASPDCRADMVPIPFSDFVKVFAPWEVKHGQLNFIIVSVPKG